MLSYSKSCLIGAMLETLAYGLYLSYFLQGMQIILSRRKRMGSPSIRLLLTSLVLFFLITMRMVLDNKAVVEAFTNDPITPHAADIYLENFGNGAMFRTGTYIALTIVADIFIVYRVYAIWAGDLIVSALPALLAIADIVSGALFIQAIRELAAGTSPDGKNAATHATVFYSFTLALNVICTLLIALRIYLTKRRLEGFTMVALLNVGTTMTILIESAAIYSVCLIAMIVPTVLGNNVQYCVLSLMPGIVGIAFSLIIVRIGSGLSPASSAGPVSELRFAGEKKSTQLDLSDLSTDEDGPRRHVALNIKNQSEQQSHSGASRSDMGYDSERTKNEHELDEMGV
ncbi:hypothetical protein MSAN_01145900 [Mycena sanguinolenta]|uniref:Uncharacterized protein n=1 Tax=Mycena sanguinolenta TaxID=230812 RepID=A0A8H6YLY3_9AGAR|nr:hypothetical protein MSAN_01145900 [Mycena sanguinolenta]